ncbi:hypothetical protein U8527_09145 [Kordia algicida OT-1]|uniref:Uncharacterized protein n=1 Tax=Kordia algicida OT-1 TaxID=391587 RepID=A9DUA2_9FLAO|nr:hypothetical protein [Kordia algicida]EDP96265.1 hypothetical protein KAOT1_02612 [Kordia algicida OT-1]
MLTKQEVLAKIHAIWEFETARLIHDIPIPVREKDTNTKTIYIPEEALDWEEVNEYQLIGEIATKLSSQAYLITDDNKIDLVKTTYSFDDMNLNYTIVAENFSWILVNTAVFTGIGIALVFGGENFMKAIQEKLSHHKEYISTWL